MKFKLNQVYMGNIEKIVKPEFKAIISKYFDNIDKKQSSDSSNLYKEKAYLIKLDEYSDIFVDIDCLETISEKLKLRKVMKSLAGKKKKYIPAGKFHMKTTGFFTNELFVDLFSLNQVFPDTKNNKKLSLRKINKEIEKRNISK